MEWSGVRTSPLVCKDETTSKRTDGWTTANHVFHDARAFGLRAPVVDREGGPGPARAWTIDTARWAKQAIERVQWPRRRPRVIDLIGTGPRPDPEICAVQASERDSCAWSSAMSVSFPFQPLQPDPKREQASWRSMRRPKAQHGLLLLLHLHCIACQKFRSAA